MTARMFRLTQIHQKIDERFRFEMRKLRPDWAELAKLGAMKQRAKRALGRISSKSLTA